MRLTVLGGCGVWPEAGQACSGYLVEHDDFRLLVDVGYATMPRLLEHVRADQVDAVFVSHGHPDHCADLNPLLRARTLRDDRPPPLPVYALPGALDAVLALDRPGMLDAAYVLHEFTAGSDLTIGPFRAQTRLLSHWVPNAGVRLAAGGQVIAYTGDSGPSSDVVDLARGADLLVAEATYLDEVPEDSKGFQSSARDAGQQAAAAGARRLLLTHLRPGTDHSAARAAARDEYDGEVDVATAGVILDLPEDQPCTRSAARRCEKPEEVLDGLRHRGPADGQVRAWVGDGAIVGEAGADRGGERDVQRRNQC
ncbi:Ribonuclease BN, tRNA processing enzyme [Micromonospora cremea]|uniref:Ribonuclease BN, tRNA processing enzyme n=2 Tax=Micromonospora cremea TaxID=709881 RepID=A0A1N6AQN6_9ACTN|nr:Ribonuclease BN, tRNA processing enzyme [Micromonospora cremea]